LLAEIGREGDRDRFRVEFACGVFGLTRLLALERPIGADLSDLLC
jgi:hypothetical protein